MHAAYIQNKSNVLREPREAECTQKGVSAFFPIAKD